MAEPHITPSDAELQARGLYDPDAPNAADRLATLRFLLERGATLDELVQGVRDGRLAAVAADLIIAPGGERLTVGEVADRAGVAVESVLRAWRTSGFPDPGRESKLFLEADAELFKIFDLAVALFGEEGGMQLGRVIGSSVARIAEAAVSVFERSVATALSEQGRGELALTLANAEAGAMLQYAGPTLDALLRHHIEAAIRRFLLARRDVEGFTSARLAVGFADLVSSTTMTAKLSSDELAYAFNDFEALASDIVAARDGRLVKLIGDEVMYATPDAAAACEIALDLREALDEHLVLPPVRVGIAYGDVVTQDGDYYGSPVNLAARIARLVEPAVVVSREVATAAEHAKPLAVTALGSHNVKGFDDPVPLWTVERA
jgi:adenylate cyclase